VEQSNNLFIQVFAKADPLLLDLISQIMIYSPKQRLNAAEALAHDFFDELRE
jgi:glycogen synthase kinase 3 beta